MAIPFVKSTWPSAVRNSIMHIARLPLKAGRHSPVAHREISRLMTKTGIKTAKVSIVVVIV